MKLRSILILVFSFLLACSVTWAANTITYAPGIITIVPDGSEDWDSSIKFPVGLKVTGVHIKGTSSDKVVFRDRSATGTVRLGLTDGLGFGVYWPITNPDISWYPYMKATDCTFGTPANVTIIIEHK